MREVIEATVECVEACYELPAVAVHDWCERAARAVGRIGAGHVAVLIGPMTAGGEIAAVDGAGAWAARGSAVAGASVPLRAVSRLGWEAGKLDASGEATLLNGCSVGEGGPVEALAAIRAGTLHSVIGGVVRPSRQWSMAVYLTPDEEGRVEECVEMLRGVLPLLGRRALSAFGEARPKRSTWVSVREWQVIRGLCEGKSPVDIALELKLSRHTVHDHLKALHRRLGAHSRGQLVARVGGLTRR